MSKLLVTRLPSASRDVSPDLFNRLVRILEINLGSIDPDKTPQFNDQQISTLSFREGDVIWNSSIGVLQVYNGLEWVQISSPTNPEGYQLKASVGSLSVKTNGNITVSLGNKTSGWNTETFYT
tara:strand:+ start:979 stop:1347 length:369 start_codon:yes stop_codon:yes gene_type:complete